MVSKTHQRPARPHRVTVCLTPELGRTLTRTAAGREASVASVVRLAVREHLRNEQRPHGAGAEATLDGDQEVRCGES